MDGRRCPALALHASAAQTETRLAQFGCTRLRSRKEEKPLSTAINLLAALPEDAGEEVFTELLRQGGVRIERIVSTGQATPIDAPYCQPHDEWVLLLAGAAGLWIEGEEEIGLRPGDCLLIPAGRRHRVTWTSADPPTVWLAVHFPPAS
jgi:cupin 2 domain-containing protein